MCQIVFAEVVSEGLNCVVSGGVSGDMLREDLLGPLKMDLLFSG